MGEGKKQGLRVRFDGRLKLEFHGANITSDADCWSTANWIRHWS